MMEIISILTHSDSLWILLIGSLLSISAALVGSILFLRKMTMVGDAISHAALPGIVIAFLLTGSRSPFLMLGGAVIVGILTTVLIEFLSKRLSVREDSGIGITFTALFAIGVILLTIFADNVDLDQECVLYGELAYAPLDTISIGSAHVPRSLFNALLCFFSAVGIITLFFKEVQITTFDPSYSTTTGISASLWHYLLMSAVSVITVLSFESVGAILVVALLVAPATVGYLLSRKLWLMLLLSALAAILSTFGGYTLSVVLDSSVAASIAVTAGFLVLVVALLSPKARL